MELTAFLSMALVLLCLILRAEYSACSENLPRLLDKVFATSKGVIQTIAMQSIPTSLGNCYDNSVPKPCSGNGDLYYSQGTLYTIKARWVSGINTTTFKDMELVYLGDGTMEFYISLEFQILPVSIQAQYCTPFAGCIPVLDDTTTCCGANKTLRAVISTTCNEEYPFLRNVLLHNLSIEPSLDVSLNVLGKSVSVYDITDYVETSLHDALSGILDRGVIEAINEYLQKLVGTNVSCEAPSTSLPPALASVVSSSPPQRAYFTLSIFYILYFFKNEL